MPSKTRQNIILYAGSAERFTISVQQADGSVKDISAATAIEWRMAANELSVATPTLEKTLSAGGIIIDDGPNGVMSVVISEANTEALVQGEYYHECRITIAGQTKTVTTGKVTVYDSLFAPTPP